MTKERYVDEHYTAYIHYWTTLGLGVGSLVVLMLSPLDYAAIPEKFRRFLFYRLIAAGILFILYLINRKTIKRSLQNWSVIAAGAVVAAMLAAMVRDFHGHESPYFAGFILVAIFVSGIIPITFGASVIAALLVYSLYLLPILEYDTITNMPYFLSANILILASIASLLLLQYLRAWQTLKEFKIEYDQREAEEALLTRERQLAESQRIALIGSWERNLSNDRVVWSDEMFRIFGLDPGTDEATFKAFLELVHPEDREDLKKALREAVELRKSYAIDCRLTLRDGGTKTIHAQGELVLDAAGKPVLLRGTAQDITERRKAEEALRDNETVLRSFMNAITESALLMDREGRVLAANETVAKRLGSHGQEITGKNLYDLLPPDVSRRRKVHLDAVFRTGVPDRFEDERLGKVIDSSVYPVFDPTGAVSAIAIIGIDITERKRAESALEFSEKKYRMLYDSAIDAIFIVDLSGKFIDINRTAHERLGYSREELMGLHLSQLDHPDYAMQVGSRIEQLQQQGDLIFESAHRRKDGSAMPVEINARIIDYDGRKAIFSIVRDITDRKLAEQERENLIAELQKALTQIKALHGILPICASCKKIRDDSGAWHQMEAYIRDHTDAEFSHGLCVDCAKKLYPEFMSKKG